MTNTHNELFFVEVRGPNEARKNILESLRSILEVLQRFEKFKHIRQEKLEHIQKLRIFLRDANKTLGKLKTIMPQTNLKASSIKETQKEPKKSHAKKTKTGKSSEDRRDALPKREPSDLDKLESELSAIEGKLRNLT